MGGAGRAGWAPTRAAQGAGDVVLCVAADPVVRAQLAALCEAAGARARPQPQSPSAQEWAAAAAVLVAAAGPDGDGATLVGHLAALPRRPGVVVVHEPGGGSGPMSGGGSGDGPGDPGEPPASVWRAAVAVGAEHVAVLPAARAWLLERLARAAHRRALTVAVVGARGGAGASSTAVALASAAVRTASGTAEPARVLLLDADPHGGGLDLALGAEELPGLRWADLDDVSAPLPRGGLSSALPDVDGVRLLSHGRGDRPVPPAAAAAVWDAARADHDLVVVDLPRCPERATVPTTLVPAPPRGRACTASDPSGGDGPDVLIVVCPAEVRAAAAAPAVLRAWLAWCPGEVHVLVRGPSPGGLRPGDAVTAVRGGLRLLAGTGVPPVVRADVVRAEPGLAEALDGGAPFAERPRSPLRRWAELWLADRAAHGERSRAPGRETA